LAYTTSVTNSGGSTIRGNERSDKRIASPLKVTIRGQNILSARGVARTVETSTTPYVPTEPLSPMTAGMKIAGAVYQGNIRQIALN
jgi:hypothetical protein